MSIDHPLTPKAQRERATTLAFETFGVPQYYAGISSVLSLFSEGVITGIALECGHEVCYSVPVKEGLALPHAISTVNIGGRHLAEYLSRLLSERDPASGACSVAAARGVMEQRARVALTFDEESKKAAAAGGESKDTTVQLDGRSINSGDALLRCSEALFQPTLAGRDGMGLHQALTTPVKGLDPDLKAELLSNVYVSGGTSMLSGLVARLEKEAGNLTEEVSIFAEDHRALQAWHGGSTFCAVTAGNMDAWISRQEYDETGPSIVHRKCS